MPNQGFSLIELMIVISIISILTVMAIPSYQHYTLRARFAEVIAATMPYKTAVAIALQTGASKSELNHGTHWIPPKPKSSKNLETIEVKSGTINAVATRLIKQATYQLTPNDDGSQWQISGTCIELGLCRES